ncbi:hypothetical protein TanjilG_32158 [Lupinus angustifolius]|uniref:Protein FLC EXPRESSOR n=1 Tax=Lupinus angustifolius TaxID=3871 RepID=A0A1J7HUN0_LUPAN|nr:PREDICTED: protein FLC EXPRESSOR-like [Lupinus angustifolius]OIW16488.1 hypothetical protein TanjilG_32158 [Lupinus angustifolius]
MAGRKHFTRLDEPRLPPHHLPHSSSAAVHNLPIGTLEDRIQSRHREIQSLLVDNQRLAAIHVSLKQDLAVTQQDVRRLSAAASEVKAERDAQVREIYEKSLRMDAEVRAIASMSSELDQVRADVRELAKERRELSLQLESMEDESVKVRNDSQSVVKADIDAIRHEIQRGRNAIELEKKTHASNLEHRRVMDNNMIIMTREIEKLRAELANAEKRARAAAPANPSPGYHANYNNHGMGYGGLPYPPDSYSMHQIQAGVDARHQYASGASLHHPYDLHHTQGPR